MSWVTLVWVPTSVQHVKRESTQNQSVHKKQMHASYARSENTMISRGVRAAKHAMMVRMQREGPPNVFACASVVRSGFREANVRIARLESTAIPR